jgi:acyl dehydratase
MESGSAGGSAMAGLYFEEFRVGMIFDHAMHRTITEADNVLFTTMTHNPSALHLDAEYMKKSEYGRPLVNSCLTLSMMTGISIGDTTLGTTIANLGWDNVRFPKPLFPGDTIRIQTEVIAVRESSSKPDRGIVTFIHRCFNQRDEEVATCQRLALILKKPSPAK